MISRSVESNYYFTVLHFTVAVFWDTVVWLLAVSCCGWEHHYLLHSTTQHTHESYRVIHIMLLNGAPTCSRKKTFFEKLQLFSTESVLQRVSSSLCLECDVSDPQTDADLSDGPPWRCAAARDESGSGVDVKMSSCCQRHPVGASLVVPSMLPLVLMLTSP